MPGAATARETRRSILVLENETVVLEFVTRALRWSGYQVLAATDPARAYDLFSRYAPELALMLVEARLPGGGAEFIERLPTLSPRVPVVFTTSLAEGNGDCLRQLGPVMRKPYGTTDVYRAIQRFGLSAPDASDLLDN